MKWIFLLVCVAVVLSVVGAGTEDRTFTGVLPGLFEADIGGGHVVSFVLDDCKAAYDIDILEPYEAAGLWYQINVYEADNPEIILEARVHVWPWDQLYADFEYPTKIDGWPGYMVCCELMAEFDYLPYSIKKPRGSDGSYDIVSKLVVEVCGDQHEEPEGLEIFRTVLGTIHYEGP